MNKEIISDEAVIKEFDNDFLKVQILKKAELITSGREKEEQVFKLKTEQADILREIDGCKYEIYNYIQNNRDEFGLKEWEVVNQVDLNKETGRITLEISDQMESFKKYFKESQEKLLSDFKKSSEPVQEVK